MEFSQLERAYDFSGGRLRGVYRYVSLGPQPQLQEVAALQQATPFGAGLALLEPCTAKLLDPVTGDEVGELVVGIASGQPACVEIRALHGHAFSGAYLRSLPIAEIVREAALPHTVRIFKTRRGTYVGLYYVVHPDVGFGDGFRELQADLEATASRKRRKIDSEFLEHVAEVYREAALGPKSAPARAVQERFGPTTAENARRWISLARKRGFLGEAPGRGQAGEQGGHDG